MKAYPEEVLSFVREHAAEHTTRELADLVNARFGLNFTRQRMKDYKRTHGIKNNAERGISDDVKEYIRCSYEGVLPVVMMEKVNKKFGTNYTKKQISGFYSYEGLKSGISARGKKKFTRLFPQEVLEYMRENYEGVGPTEMTERLNQRFDTAYTVQQIENRYYHHGMLSGAPKNRPGQGIMPVGHERKGRTGEMMVKVSMEGGNGNNIHGTYRPKHHVVWEKVNGPLPEGSEILFLDGDRTNCDISNLRMVTRQEAGYLFMQQGDIKSTAPEVMDARITLSKIAAATKNAKEKLRADRKEGDD